MPFIRKVRVLCKTHLIFPRINGPNITGVASKLKHERDVLEKDMKVLQEQFNEQSEKLNMIQEKLASYTPRNGHSQI